MKCFILPAFLILFLNLNGQNLIPNPGFESYHTMMRCLGCDSWEISDFINDWQSKRGHVSYYSKDYSPTPTEFTKGYDLENFPPHAGKSMVKFAYALNYNNPNGQPGGYLHCKLNEPLKRGKKYHLSFWVYLKDNEVYDIYRDFYRQIGVGFTNDEIVDNKSMWRYPIYLDTPFRIDSAGFKEWTKLDFYFEAPFNASYLVFGAFDSYINPMRRFPDYWGLFEFFADDFLLEMVSDSMEVMTFNENEFSNLPLEVPVDTPLVLTSIFFDKDSPDLKADELIKLDLVLDSLNSNPNIFFEIVGYADQDGTDTANQILSADRAEVVANAIRNLSLSKRQFLIAKGRGELIDNEEENRRVDIIRTDSKGHHLLYSQAVEVMQSDPKESIRLLKEWIKWEEESALILLHDQQLEPLKKIPEWKAIPFILDQIFKSKFHYGELAKQWQILAYKDQIARNLDIMLERIRKPLPDFKWEAPELFSEGYRKLDSLNFLEVKALYEKSGFQNPAEVGPLSTRGFILILQHNASIENYEMFLPDIVKAYNNGWLPKKYAMMVIDRYLEQKGEKQIFGTQYHFIGEDSKSILQNEINHEADNSEIMKSFGFEWEE
jgi:hypothetical protein